MVHMSEFSGDAPHSRQAGFRSFGKDIRPYRDVFKRLSDIVIVVAAFPVTLSLIILMALLVAADGHNPFFWQTRIGRSGRVFRIIKMRTMIPQAEAKLTAYLRSNPAAAMIWHERQKLEDDPRVTRVGKILRRFSMDELPQMWNVLLGDMSLVGPRPMLVSQQALYPGKEYYRLRPGITGPWQVSERHGSEFVTRADYDAEYLRTVSLITDIKILARTVVVVVRATGC